MTDIFLARALHVLGVVIWIGGVSMVTAVIMPAVRNGDLGSDKLAAFEAVERRFVWQARATVLLVGITGFYLIDQLDMWSRLWDFPDYWWMHAMLFVWTLFMLILFIGEPLVLHKYFPILVARDPDNAFALLHRAHVGLTLLSFITIVGATFGAHGGQLF